MAQRLRLFAFPRGSVRERVAFLAKVSVLEVRRGPRAWWSAVRCAARLLVGQRAHQSRPPSPLAPTGARATTLTFAGEVADLVSVVLPVYNQASLLGDAIASVLAQTHTNLELIVINDGSVDGVEAVFDRFASDRRVRFLTQPNQKLPKALSNGFDLARGEFWTWTSADNLMEPRHLERLVACLRARPDVDFVFADYYAIDDRGQMLADPAFRPHNRRSPTAPDIHLPQSMAGYNDGQDNFIGPCFLYRGRVGKVMGDYSPELGVEDYDYWLRMNTIMRMSHLGTEELLYRYRVHDNSLYAQSKELGIPSRKDRLLPLDRRRRQELARPWTVVVDAQLTQSLGNDEARKKATPERGAHTVALVPPERLTPSAAGNRATHVVAWFDGTDAEAPYRHRDAVRAHAHACLAADATTADRLALFTDQAFVVPAGVARAFAELHAKSTLLRDFKQVPAQRHRLPARVRLPSDRALRVVLQVDDFAQGGLEQVVLDLARTLREAGADVRLLILGKVGDAATHAAALGIAVVQLPTAERDRHYQALLRSGVDVLNAHYSTFGADLAAAQGVPFVQTVHNTYVWLDAAQTAAIRRSVPATTAFACVSAEAARYTDVVLGVPPNKLIVLTNGIEPSAASAGAGIDRNAVRAELGWLPSDFVFLQVASIYPPKAQRIALHALNAVRLRHPQAKVAFAGRALEEVYHALVARETQSLGLTSAAHFLGHRDDVGRLLAAADAFLLPSYWEGWSLAVAEAAVAGLPLVLSDVGAAREQVAVAGGRLVQPPFASITEVRRETLGAVVHTVQAPFVAALAAAMSDACTGRVAKPDIAACAVAFDRRAAYGQHVRLFQWLAAGGALASARSWLRQPATMHAGQGLDQE